MDTKGQAYRSLKADAAPWIADSFREYERNIELDIQKQLKDTFAFSGASVIVRVQANATSSNSEELKYGAPQVKESEETTVKKGNVGPPAPRVQKGGAEGEPPAESSLPSESQTSAKESRVLNQKKTVEVNPAGQINRITVGVLIPVEVGAEGKELTEAEKLLPKLKEFVRIAATPARSEDISVQFFPTKRPEPGAAQATSGSPLVWLSMHASKIALFGLALAGLFVLLRVVQTAMARDTVEEIQSLTAALTEPQAAGADLVGPAESELGRLKQNVQEMVGRNPQSVAASLKSFMSGR
jgi:flagellar biosynthesis/type III secretory pathway M-ring protein FliF/YscJ